MTDNHPRYRLGRRKPDPQHMARSLKVRDYLPAAGTITPPVAVDHFAKVSDWGLYKNDTFGICGPTAAANLRKLITCYLTGMEEEPAQLAVDELYALQNPGFNSNVSQPGGPQDGGVDLQTMCEDLLRVGIGGKRAVAFAQVDVNNEDEIRDCVTLFGAVILGVDLEVAQQQQTDQGGPWSYVASGEWGGHAILTGKFDSLLDDCVTWGEQMGMTGSFRNAQYDEGWVIIWPEHLDMPGFVSNVDLAQLAADYKQLTGKDFPLSNPPEPTPAPTPAPAPAGGLASELQADWQQLVGKIRAEVEAEKGPVVEAAQNELGVIKSEAAQLLADGKAALLSHVSAIEGFLQKHGL